ncbi:class F sortase [Streptoalloteichus hindustanus]|uniref:class F sortase n=1 Tax=Streptoalloteichus hindustanus TaxID=2017 RepID=UPI001F45B69D|nr:class F sortase [Streptoalloteichus hindustanus]
MAVLAVALWAAPPDLVPGTPTAGDPPPAPPAHSLRDDEGRDRHWGVPGGGAPGQEPPAAEPAEGQAAAEPEPSPPRPAAGQRPGTVRLPAGGTARLVRKEVGRDGVLPVPEGVGDATWWGAGLRAAAGATVLAGHVNWRGATGPFAELWRTQRGQEVSVADAAGTAWRYRVTEVHTVDKDDLPARANALFGQEGAHRLVLVTCGGRWVGGDLGYDENRIVVAEPTT